MSEMEKNQFYKSNKTMPPLSTFKFDFGLYCPFH